MTAVRRKASVSVFLRRCQAETPSMMTAPVTSEARITWVKPHRKTGLVKRARNW